MATSLTSDICTSVSEATSLFSSRKGLLVLRPNRACSIGFSFSIPSGCYALVTRHGADLDYLDENNVQSATWPAGLHFPYPPWISVSYLVTKQSIILDLPVKACKTKDNVTVNIDTALTFRVMGDMSLGEDPYLVRKFVYELKAEGLEQQLRDAQEESIRALARSLNHTDVYGMRSATEQREEEFTTVESQQGQDVEIQDEFTFFLSGSSSETNTRVDDVTESGPSHRPDDISNKMRRRLNKQFMTQGIQIQSVVVMSVSLPDDIQEQMKDKTMMISARAQQVMYHNEAMQSTRMEEEIRTKQQEFEEEQQEETIIGQEQINKEQMKLNDAVAEAAKADADIREETRVYLEKIEAQNAFEIQRINDSSKTTDFAEAAKASKLSSELQANTHAECENLLSEAHVKSSRNLAEVDKKLSKAEGEIAGKIGEKMKFQTEMKKIEVYSKLAENEDFILGSSDPGGNLLAAADAVVSADEPSPTSVAAELSILGLATRYRVDEQDEDQKLTTKALHTFSPFSK